MRKEAGLVLGAGSALGSASSEFSLSQSSPEVGLPEGKVPPILSLEESAPKTQIQYKRKCKNMGKPKLVVGQGEHDDVGFLKRGFLKSSSSSCFLADCSDVPSVLDGSFRERLVESAGGVQPLSFGVISVMFHGGVRVQGARG